MLALVIPSRGSCNMTSFILYPRPCSFYSVFAPPVSLFLVLSRISAISLLSCDALSALVTPGGSPHVASLVLSHPQPCPFTSVSALIVSLPLLLSGISAISLLSGDALLVLVTPAAGSFHHVAPFVFSTLNHDHPVLSQLYQSYCFWCYKGFLQYPF